MLYKAALLLTGCAELAQGLCTEYKFYSRMARALLATIIINAAATPEQQHNRLRTQ